MREEGRTASSGLGLAVLGWITVAFWLSMAVFPQRIPPLAPWPNVAGLLQGVPEWTRQQAGLDRPDHEIISSMNRELLAVYAFQWFEIAVGVASGVLLLLGKRAGRVLALILCAALLGWWAIYQVRMLLEPTPHFIAYWTVTPRVAPWTFVRWIVDVLFYVVTLAFLLFWKSARSERVGEP